MDLSAYVERVRRDLAATAAAAGPEVVEAAERLIAGVDATVRLVLLDALTDAAAEITTEIGDGAVEVRLRARDPEFVVTAAPPSVPPSADADGDDGAGASARITLRLPESLKHRAEQAADESRQSLNTWLVDAVRTATTAPDSGRRARRGGSAQHMSGWVR